ncbi:FUN14 domain-containing protein [Haloferacaceae archaeon DSL9]
MVGVDPQQLGLEAGSGAIVGAIIGYAVKKVAKLLAIIIGVELALLRLLEARGILTVDWDRVSTGFVRHGQDAASGAPPDWLLTILSTLSISAGFTAGFLLGYKKG